MKVYICTYAHNVVFKLKECVLCALFHILLIFLYITPFLSTLLMCIVLGQYFSTLAGNWNWNWGARRATDMQIHPYTLR